MDSDFDRKPSIFACSTIQTPFFEKRFLRNSRFFHGNPFFRQTLINTVWLNKPTILSKKLPGDLFGQSYGRILCSKPPYFLRNSSKRPMATERQETVKEGFNELKRLIQRAGEGSQEARVQSAADAEDDLLR